MTGEVPTGLYGDDYSHDLDLDLGWSRRAHNVTKALCVLLNLGLVWMFFVLWSEIIPMWL